jgi:hypothetical protein
MLLVLSYLMFLPLVSYSTEITPLQYNWIDSPVKKGVQIQIIFHHSGAISKKAENFHITVWIRNSSNMLVTVPYPGDRLVDGLVDFLDQNGKSMLRGVPCSDNRVPMVLRLVNNEIKGTLVDVFQQRCTMLEKKLLKNGAYYVEFMGYKKPISLKD